jgi:hypothetical protein
VHQHGKQYLGHRRILVTERAQACLKAPAVGILEFEQRLNSALGTSRRASKESALEAPVRFDQQVSQSCRYSSIEGKERGRARRSDVGHSRHNQCGNPPLAILMPDVTRPDFRLNRWDAASNSSWRSRYS